MVKKISIVPIILAAALLIVQQVKASTFYYDTGKDANAGTSWRVAVVAGGPGRAYVCLGPSSWAVTDSDSKWSQSWVVDGWMPDENSHNPVDLWYHDNHSSNGFDGQFSINYSSQPAITAPECGLNKIRVTNGGGNNEGYYVMPTGSYGAVLSLYAYTGNFNEKNEFTGIVSFPIHYTVTTTYTP